MLHGMSGQRPRRWRRAIDDPATRAAVAPLARAAAAVAWRVVGAVPAACGLGVARDVRGRLFVSHDVYECEDGIHEL